MVTLRFYEELNDFLPVQQRKTPFQLAHTFPRSVKDLIESVGVPHVEVDLILVNGESVSFDYPVQDGDRISVYPVFEELNISSVTRLHPKPLRESRFIADVHLKTLARKLRMLGFDTLYNPDWDDPDLARIAAQDERILLTRDVGLLKRSIVQRGLFIRSGKPAEQLRHVLTRLDLFNSIHPLTRCILCNAPLARISTDTFDNSEGQVPEDVLGSLDHLSRCSSCGRIYWKGSHYAAMQEQIRRIRESANG